MELIEKTPNVVSEDGKDPKHEKYFDSYKPNEVFFGVGIENETYFVFDKPMKWRGKNIKSKYRRERYSVNYFDNFKTETINKFMDKINDNDLYDVPLFLNTHTFIKCDKNNQHKTLYTKDTEPNPKFDGVTLDEVLKESSKYLSDNFDKKYTYDGDTLEIMTNNFYCAKVNDVVDELVKTKKDILSEVQRVFKEKDIFTKYGEITLQEKNYGLVSHMSNINNVVVCNNGTYHFNITLPTKLNDKAEIQDIDKFVKTHANAIRAIQWFEPLFVACYGSPDIFSLTDRNAARGSLRCVLSRYIGVGIYDSSKMPKGKLLDDYAYGQDHWYARMHNETAYNPPKTIGYDINFNKFKNHGIEVRFFDMFPEEYLNDVLNTLVLICEFSLHNEIPDPHVNKSTYLPNIWEEAAIIFITKGSDDNLYTDSEKRILIEYFGMMNDIFTHSKVFTRKIKKHEKKKKYNLDDLLNAITVFFTKWFNDEIKEDTSSDSESDCDINIREKFQGLVNELYSFYKITDEDSFAKKASPDMERPRINDYNDIMNKVNKSFIDTGKYL